jgi:hypothetical protein
VAQVNPLWISLRHLAKTPYSRPLYSLFFSRYDTYTKVETFTNQSLTSMQTSIQDLAKQLVECRGALQELEQRQKAEREPYEQAKAVIQEKLLNQLATFP